ncbi:MAG: carboxy terminal-processing peptidase [Pseudomonadota bacterium]
MTRKALVFVFAVAVSSAAGAKPQEYRPVALEPTDSMSEASRWATTFLTRAHYKKTRLDDELSSQILDRYVESLDPNRIFFLASDIRSFEAYRESLDDALNNQQLSPAFEIFNVYSHRVFQRTEYASRLLERNFNFEIEETVELDRSEEAWAESEKELNEIWRKRVKNDVLRLRLADKEDDAATELLSERYDNLARRVSELDSEDVFQYFMNAFAAAIEPHTGYLAPRSSENFNISMRLSLEGIGAVLQRENEYTVIRRIVVGGPASDDGRLNVGDRIISVGQEGEEPVDVVGWRLDDVVDLIRGPAGSQVRLSVIPAEQGVDGEVVAIDIVRDKVKLEEQAAQKAIYDIETEAGKSTRIGVIDLPAFYLDFAARARREADFRSSTRDVRRLIEELKAAEVDAVVVDLRNNGGGSLAEATTLTGLFIDEGPVVQVQDSNGRIDVETDTEEGVEWEGPLAVLVNRHSASASEIFAAAIQDYGRGLVIGEPTFGKGTVQNLINLDRYAQRDNPNFGQLRLTIAQFFRVNGGSTQHRGVIPDVVFPTLDPTDEYGESAYDNALPWTSIRPARYQIAGDLSAVVPLISERSQARLSNDADFRFLLEDIEEFREARDDTTVSLVESARRSELDARKEADEARKAAREAWREQAQSSVISIVEPLPEMEEDVTVMEEAGDVDGEAEEENPANDRDVLLEETVRIISDFVWLSQGERTAQLPSVKPSVDIN